MFTFGHFPIVFGLVLYAVAAKHAVAHPIDPLDRGDLAVLAGAVALFVGGLAGLQWRAVRRLAPERVVVIIGVAVLCLAVGPLIPSGVLLAEVALIVAIMQAISLRRFERLAAVGRG
jgi:low temperature requirement protein LtrA